MVFYMSNRSFHPYSKHLGCVWLDGMMDVMEWSFRLNNYSSAWLIKNGIVIPFRMAIH